MKNSLPRRHFIQATSLATGAIVLGVPTLVRGKSLNSKLNIACIGVRGKGQVDTDCCAGENIVALCDVDAGICGGQRQKYPGAKFYQDFRRMFDQMGRDIDAVTVSTPDHFHAVAASRALRLKKHVYCQKPLAQTIYEARYLRELAHTSGVVTQMGNQGSAADGLRRGVECVQAGVIGAVRELHVWTEHPWWPSGIARPAGSDPVPPTLDWDTWIGPAPLRPFKLGNYNQPGNAGVYHRFNWRGWQDFGCGALGDIACHVANMPMRALGLYAPTEIEAEAINGMNRETYPTGATIRFQFPARTIQVPAAHPTWFHRHDMLALEPATLWWYDGGYPLPDKPGWHDAKNKPPRELMSEIMAMRGEIPRFGYLLLGEKGKIFSDDVFGGEFFVKMNDEAKFTHSTKYAPLAAVPRSIVRNPFKGSLDNQHHLEWLTAIKEGKPEMCYSRFDIGAKLSEIPLLGCVALRAGKKIEWDGPNMRVVNCPEAASFIKRDNRAGWPLA